MKTITFYSYKGGVGRTLALANMAKRLTEFNKKVCIVDFDLEAPGLHYKFEKELDGNFNFKKGLVDYISHFTINGKPPNMFTDYVHKINFSQEMERSIDFIPAGNTGERHYWENLRELNLKQLMRRENGEGILFFLDLKQRIEDELNPDYLLIDSRTGITEVFGISISLLADSVVVVSANNSENFQGSKMIINSISIKDKHFSGKVPDIFLVISRFPYPENTHEKLAEDQLIETTVKQVESKNFDKQNVIIIHSDRQLEKRETLKIGYFVNAKEPTANDYTRLFGALFDKDLTDEEKKEFEDEVATEEKFKKTLEEGISEEECIALLSEVIAAKPELHEAYNNRGIAYCNVKDFSSAIKDFNVAISLQPNEPSYYFNRALTYDDIGQAEDAISDYIKVLEIKPEVYGAAFNLGLAYTKQAEYQLAIQFYKNALEIKPNFIDGLANLGAVYSRIKEPEKAINYFLRILEIDPNEDRALYSLGREYMKTKDYEKANDYFQRSLNVNPKNDKIWLQLGQAHYFLKNYSNAIEYLEKCIEINSKSYFAFIYLGLVYSQKNKMADARKSYKKATELDDKRFEAWYYIGVLYLKFKKLNSAKKYIEKAYLIEENSNTNMKMGHINFIKGLNDKAIFFYKKSIELYNEKMKFYDRFKADYIYLKANGVSKEAFDKMLEKIGGK